MEYLLTLIGLAILIVSGNYLITGAVQIARYFKLSSLVIGATVVALGTSAPELIISIKAALSGHPDMAVGNVIGSNIANIALILALTAIIIPIPVKSRNILRDWIFMIIASILLLLFITDNKIAIYEGFLLVSLLIYFVYRSVNDSRKEGNKQEIQKPTMKIWLAIIISIISLIGLAFGADWLVKGASEIARNMGVSEKIISISLVAFGTSVPELTASIIAAIKKETDISIGNIIGSNVFNIYAVIGIASIIQPIEIDNFLSIYLFDIISMLIIAILLILFIIPVRNGILNRWKGGILLLTYIIYMYILFSH